MSRFRAADTAPCKGCVLRGRGKPEPSAAAADGQAASLTVPGRAAMHSGKCRATKDPSGAAIKNQETKAAFVKCHVIGEQMQPRFGTQLQKNNAW